MTDINKEELHMRAAEQRYLEIFAQLMRLTPFQKWLKENIRIDDEIDEKEMMITTTVIYLGEEEPERNKDQNIVRCPHCKLSFDANAEAPLIQIAKTIKGKNDVSNN